METESVFSIPARPATNPVEDDVHHSYMPRHYTIYKFNPRNQERVVLHDKVPEALADWLSSQSETELSRKEKAGGYVILKEPQAHQFHEEPDHPKKSKSRTR